MKSLVISKTAIRQDAVGRFCLNDLHRAAGGQSKHRPGQFARTDQFKGLVAELRKEGVRDFAQAPVAKVNDGFNNGTYVCKELVYAYAMWISPAFNLQVIRAYDSLQFSAMSLYQQLQALVAEEVSTQVRASFGARLMLERKRAIPEFRRRRELLESELQPSLQLH
ncbi:KilA-N domain-containing protein [Achromobacter anxifer]|uniref:KilA-N domain-containing protein n=1 Tax=Achromobacter anxifer TaxID=1287737 RepID=UPI002157F805|nr:KilA-N domain-containing protein [Achromobacter anxifer]